MKETKNKNRKIVSLYFLPAHAGRKYNLCFLRGFNIYILKDFNAGYNYWFLLTFFTSCPKLTRNIVTNIIKFQKDPGDWGWMFVDSFIIEEGTEIVWDFNISTELINPKSNAETKKLYKYLCNIYGEQMLAGQQVYSKEEKEIDKIFTITGKYPAIKGYDMINQTPGDYIDDQVERAIEWHLEHKGIVTMCWHWWAPKYEREFYTEKTQFDVTKAVTPGTEEYELILRDMDIVAERLKEMGEVGIPVLWRPLHEASGGWFWWGAKGPEPFKELWKLIYERFTGYHKLNNLIWIWNGQDPDWYVGDEYCDIIGEDIYPGERVYSAHTIKFSECYNIVKGTKPIALTETGCLPNIDQIQDTGAWWLWFMIWWGDFITTDIYNEYEMLKYIYNHENVITLDELPEF